MAKIHSIQALSRSKHSAREIARLLGVDRGTVNKYIRRLQAISRDQAADPAAEDPSSGPAQNRPNPQTGSGAPELGPEAGAAPPGNGEFGDLPPIFG